MKKRIIIALFIVSIAFLSGSIHAQKKGFDLNWQTNFGSAKQMAKKNNKLVLIYFTGSDWSTACKKLNEDFFYTKKFKELADKNLILVRINKPRRPDLISELQEHSNQQLSKEYDQKVYPTVVITDPEGKKLGMVESYNYLHDTSKHYALINDALKKKVE